MFQFFRKSLGWGSTNQRNVDDAAITTAGTTATGINVVSLSRPAVVQYPPQDPGLVLPTVAEMMIAQEKIIGMLRIHSAERPEKFLELYLDPIQNVAKHIANLPGSASGVFGGEGGLFRACVEMAFHAFRASDGRIFTGNSGVEERHLLEARWRYVCFAAALVYPIGRSLDGMQVLGQEKTVWSPELDSLTDYVGVGQRYWVTWRRPDCEPGPSPITAMVIGRVFGRSNIDWLNKGSPELFRRIVEIASGASGAATLIATSVVKDTWASIHERESARRHQNYGRLVVGSHISPYIIDAMVTLAQTTWVMNKHVLYADREGVYIEWPRGALEIIQYCTAHSYRGVPDTASALLTMMVGNGIIDANQDGVALLEIADSEGDIVGAVKLVKPGLLIDDLAPYMLPGAKVNSVKALVQSDPLKTSTPEDEVGKLRPNKRSKPIVDKSTMPKLDTLVIDETEPEADENIVKTEGTEQPDVSPPTTTQSCGAEQSVATVGADKTDKTAQADKADKADKGAGFKEASEVSYAHLVPPDRRVGMSGQAAEMLGAVIHAWNNRSAEQPHLMRMTAVGAAVQIEFLLELSTRATYLINDLALNGVLYVDPKRNGIKVHDVAVLEGGQQKVSCIIITPSNIKAFGMRV